MSLLVGVPAPAGSFTLVKTVVVPRASTFVVLATLADMNETYENYVDQEVHDMMEDHYVGEINKKISLPALPYGFSWNLNQEVAPTIEMQIRGPNGFLAFGIGLTVYEACINALEYLEFRKVA